MASLPPRKEPLAIVGLGALFPGSTDVHGFWRDVHRGRDQLREIPEAHWLIADYFDSDPKAPDKTYARRGAFIDDVPFDPLEFGMPPSILPATDTSQLLGLIVAKKLLDDATLGGALLSDSIRERTSVILGITSAQELLVEMGSRLQRPVWVRALREAGLPESEVQKICDRIADSYTPWQENTFPGLLGNVVAGRIANRLNLGGTNCVVDAACASTFGALAMGAQELYLGSSDLVITGGVETFNDIFMFMCFSKTTALSFSGDCRPFDAKSDGTMLGEGIGLVALRRLSDAERDGNPIWAVLQGIGSSSDGKAKSIYAPVAQGQAKALRRAYEAAGYGPETVELVEAHGTGTKAGDVAEFEGLRSVFDASGRSDRQWCALGSIKSQIGHTKAAAGAAGLVKATLALRQKVFPPTIKLEEPNPALRLPSTPFYLNSTARPWIRDSSHPRRASVSSFGFGGSNFHLTLEEYVGDGPRAPRLRADLPAELVALSAESMDGLRARLNDVLREVAAGQSLSGLAAQSVSSFRAGHDTRAAFVVSSSAELKERVESVAAKLGDAKLPAGVSFGRGPRAEGQIAFIFPGQGSQALAMGGDLAMAFEPARAAWDESADLRFGASIPGERGLAVHDVVFPPPAFDDEARKVLAARLTATEWAQPSLGVASLATLRLLRFLGVDADVFAGHSFGEVTALHAAGAFDLVTFLKIARRRGELMRDASASTPGAMFAVLLGNRTVRDVEEALRAAPDVVIANRNSPRQVVLAGPTEAAAAAAELLHTKGLRTTRLPVATAFHSPVVARSVSPFAAFLAEAKVFAPERRVYANSTAAPYEASADAVRRTLAGQIASPVRFAEQIEAMWSSGVRTFVEVGPGSVLTSLVKETLGERPFVAVATDRATGNGALAFLQAIGQLATQGCDIRLERLFEGSSVEPARIAPKPHAVMISGTNFAKPYPPKAGPSALPAPNPDRGVAADVAAEKLPAVDPLPVAAIAEPGSRPAGEPAPLIMSGTSGPPTTPTAGTSTPDALQAFGEIQRQTAEAHAAFQRSMADAHMAFLRTAEAAMTAIGGGQDLLGVGFGSAPSAIATANWAPTLAAVGRVSPVVPDLIGNEAARERSLTPAPGLRSVASDAVGSKTQSSPTVSPPPSVVQSADGIAETLLDIVALKTGYPKDMVGLDMEIEADLGIDSIKRVEILSAVQERLPGVVPIPAAELGSLRTLRSVLDRLGSLSPLDPSRPLVRPGKDPTLVSAAPLVPSAPFAASPPPAAEPAAPDAALPEPAAIEAVLLAVVAEKTGYPKDMIGLDMDVEADLGIDSIKRVEILSAVQERLPNLPAIPAADLGGLRTLGAIVIRLRPAAGVLAGRSDGAADLAPTLLAVVAEKTGYPADMIGLDMDIEADLGIDSIKRVEILSTVQERLPHLPPIPAADLGRLRTLRAILEQLGSSPPRVAPDDAPRASALPTFATARRETPRPGLTPLGLRGGPVIVVRDTLGVADILCDLLAADGVAAVAMDELDAQAPRVIDLSALSDVANADEAIRIQKELFEKARDVARASSKHRLFIAVSDPGATRPGSSLGDRAWLGGVEGLVRAMSLEHPDIVCRAVRIEREQQAPESLARELASEIMDGGLTRTIEIEASGRRTALAFADVTLGGGAAQPVAPNSKPARPVLLISGGARGVTAACLLELARRQACRFAILGRTDAENSPEWAAAGDSGFSDLQRAFIEKQRAAGRGVTPAEAAQAANAVLASREIRSTLDALQALGSDVLYLPCDVRHDTDIATAVAAVRAAYGRIDGVVHAAGVLQDRRIEDKTDAQFDLVFDTKVAGALHLLAGTEHDPLRWLVFFGSVAGRIGNLGQVDYAAANETLDAVALAEATRRPGARVHVLHWGPWDGGMVGPSLKKMFEERGVGLIDLAAGARLFADLITGPASSGTPVSIVVGARPDASAFLGGHDGSGGGIECEIALTRDRWPQLVDHAVKGVPVLPVALAAELFARLARELRPELELASLRDIRAMSGVKIPEFAARGLRLEGRGRVVSNGSGAALELELRSLLGVIHYRARAEMVAGIGARRQGEVAKTVPIHELRAARRGDRAGREDFYGEHLFHGPAFQVLRDVRSLTGEGASAAIGTVVSLGWKGSFQIEAAAIDAALQLAILAGLKAKSRSSLPTSIGEIRFIAPARGAETLDCELRLKSTTELRSLSDAVITGADGAAVIEMRDIEMHLKDGIAAAGRSQHPTA